MKFKIGNKIYDGNKEIIMVILTKLDKKNIQNMLPECTKYCQFPNNILKEDVLKFMGEK